MAHLELHAATEADLPSVAERLLAACEPDRIFAFSGELGAGKTTLIQHLCAALGVVETVTSPTFGLVHEYQGQAATIYHFDLYRIEHEVELEEIGWYEYIESDAFVFIEWPERIPTLLPDTRVEVRISVDPDQERVIRVYH